MKTLGTFASGSTNDTYSAFPANVETTVGVLSESCKRYHSTLCEELICVNACEAMGRSDDHWEHLSGVRGKQRVKGTRSIMNEKATIHCPSKSGRSLGRLSTRIIHNCCTEDYFTSSDMPASALLSNSSAPLSVINNKLSPYHRNHWGNKDNGIVYGNNQRVTKSRPRKLRALNHYSVGDKENTISSHALRVGTDKSRSINKHVDISSIIRDPVEYHNSDFLGYPGPAHRGDKHNNTLNNLKENPQFEDIDLDCHTLPIPSLSYLTSSASHKELLSTLQKLWDDVGMPVSIRLVLTSRHITPYLNLSLTSVSNENVSNNNNASLNELEILTIKDTDHQLLFHKRQIAIHIILVDNEMRLLYKVAKSWKKRENTKSLFASIVKQYRAWAAGHIRLYQTTSGRIGSNSCGVGDSASSNSPDGMTTPFLGSVYDRLSNTETTKQRSSYCSVDILIKDLHMALDKYRDATARLIGCVRSYYTWIEEHNYCGSSLLEHNLSHFIERRKIEERQLHFSTVLRRIAGINKMCPSGFCSSRKDSKEIQQNIDVTNLNELLEKKTRHHVGLSIDTQLDCWDTLEAPLSHDIADTDRLYTCELFATGSAGNPGAVGVLSNNALRNSVLRTDYEICLGDSLRLRKQELKRKNWDVDTYLLERLLLREEINVAHVAVDRREEYLRQVYGMAGPTPEKEVQEHLRLIEILKSKERDLDVFEQRYGCKDPLATGGSLSVGPLRTWLLRSCMRDLFLDCLNGEPVQYILGISLDWNPFALPGSHWHLLRGFVNLDHHQSVPSHVKFSRKPPESKRVISASINSSSLFGSHGRLLMDWIRSSNKCSVLLGKSEQNTNHRRDRNAESIPNSNAIKHKVNKIKNPVGPLAPIYYTHLGHASSSQIFLHELRTSTGNTGQENRNTRTALDNKAQMMLASGIVSTSPSYYSKIALHGLIGCDNMKKEENGINSEISQILIECHAGFQYLMEVVFVRGCLARIQAIFRGFAVRRRLLRQIEAVCIIQRCLRNISVKREFRTKRKKYICKCVLLAGVWAGSICRAKLRKEYTAMKLIQRICRGFLLRMKLFDFLTAANTQSVDSRHVGLCVEGSWTVIIPYENSAGLSHKPHSTGLLSSLPICASQLITLRTELDCNSILFPPETLRPLCEPPAILDDKMPTDDYNKTSQSIFHQPLFENVMSPSDPPILPEGDIPLVILESQQQGTNLTSLYSITKCVDKPRQHSTVSVIEESENNVCRDVACIDLKTTKPIPVNISDITASDVQITSFLGTCTGTSSGIPQDSLFIINGHLQPSHASQHLSAKEDGLSFYSSQISAPVPLSPVSQPAAVNRGWCPSNDNTQSFHNQSSHTVNTEWYNNTSPILLKALLTHVRLIQRVCRGYYGHMSSVSGGQDVCGDDDDGHNHQQTSLASRFKCGKRNALMQWGRCHTRWFYTLFVVPRREMEFQMSMDWLVNIEEPFQRNALPLIISSYGEVRNKCRRCSPAVFLRWLAITSEMFNAAVRRNIHRDEMLKIERIKRIMQFGVLRPWIRNIVNKQHEEKMRKAIDNSIIELEAEEERLRNDISTDEQGALVANIHVNKGNVLRRLIRTMCSQGTHTNVRDPINSINQETSIVGPRIRKLSNFNSSTSTDPSCSFASFHIDVPTTIDQTSLTQHEHDHPLKQPSSAHPYAFANSFSVNNNTDDDVSQSLQTDGKRTLAPKVSLDSSTKSVAFTDPMQCTTGGDMYYSYRQELISSTNRGVQRPVHTDGRCAGGTSDPRFSNREGTFHIPVITDYGSVSISCPLRLSNGSIRRDEYYNDLIGCSRSTQGPYKAHSVLSPTGALMDDDDDGICDIKSPSSTDLVPSPKVTSALPVSTSTGSITHIKGGGRITRIQSTSPICYPSIAVDVIASSPGGGQSPLRLCQSCDHGKGSTDLHINSPLYSSLTNNLCTGNTRISDSYITPITKRTVRGKPGKKRVMFSLE